MQQPWQKFRNVTRVFDFLVGLKLEFDEVRGRLLGKEPIPCLSDVFSYVNTEEDRRSIMIGTISQEASALKTEQDGGSQIILISLNLSNKRNLERRILVGVITAKNQGIQERLARSWMGNYLLVIKGARHPSRKLSKGSLQMILNLKQPLNHQIKVPSIRINYSYCTRC